MPSFGSDLRDMTSFTDINPNPAARSSHLRAYLAGTGATGSLIAGAMVVFLSLAAFVAFNGVPFGGSGGGLGSARLGSQTVGPPESAAQALAPAPRTVAAAPVPGAPVGAAGPAGARLAAAAGAPVGAPTTGLTPASPGGSTSPGGSLTSPGTPSSGPITSAVNGVGQVTGQDVSPLTGMTQALDNNANSTLNGVHPGLGDQVGQTANGVTGLLGGGGQGSAGNLLGNGH